MMFFKNVRRGVPFNFGVVTSTLLSLNEDEQEFVIMPFHFWYGDD